MFTLIRPERYCPACGRDITTSVKVTRYAPKCSSPFGVRTDWSCSDCLYYGTELENVIFRGNATSV